MKTIAEIKQRLEHPPAEDIFGFQVEALAIFAPWEAAQGIVKSGVSQDEWEKGTKPLTREAVLEEMRAYMEFAWTKVQDHRGISASRSVQKVEMWLWLLGEEELMQDVGAEHNYPQYGAPALALVCRRFGFPIPESAEVQNMIDGEPCRLDCEGCGS